MITVENLCKRYDGNPILDGLSFTVKDEEIYGLLGPNGSGKSTTMKILSGILKPDEGNVIIEGVNASENQLKVKEIVGFVPESPILYESLTPAELFDFIGKVRKIPRRLLEERVNAFVKAFGIRRVSGSVHRNSQLRNEAESINYHRSLTRSQSSRS